jgi:hypothetical protein
MKVSYLVEIDVDPMQRLDMQEHVHDITGAIWEIFSGLPKEAIRVTPAVDPWGLIAESNKNKLIKLAHKAVRHGFGDHPESLTNMATLAGSIAKRLAGELWAMRKSK